MVLLVFGLMQLLQYGVKKYRQRPFVLELRRQQPLYYLSLPQHLKHDFENRVANFLLQKQFIPRGNGFEITLDMKVPIAASAVQLTFGLAPVYFSHFKRILVYPDRYYSTIFKRFHCGEVSMRGIIVLSWRDFAAGYSNSSDGFNLGLHEMAHALHLENAIRNEEYSFLDRQHLQHWHQVASQEMQKVQQQTNGFLRLQAGSDEHEFFAVCVESFFERPHPFQLAHPRLYQALSQLLQQDPARKTFRL